MTLENLLQKCEELDRAATSGPWTNEDGPEIISTVETENPVKPFPTVANTTMQWKDHERHFANAQFIAEARTLLPALVKVVREMREGLEFVVDRENFAFTECSVAEDLWGKCKSSIEAAEKIAGEVK